MEDYFESIKGYEDIKKELCMYVDVINRQQEYRDLGIRPEKGLLITGRQGTGKTMMANAVIESWMDEIQEKDADMEDRIRNIGGGMVKKDRIQQNPTYIDSRDEDNYSRMKGSWESIKEATRKENGISKNTYDFWIAPLAFDGCENGVLKICIPRGMEQCIGYLSNEYTDYFRIAIKESLNLNVDIRFITKTESENRRIKLNHCFDNFMVNQTNHFAAEACKSFADSVGSSINSLLIYGDTGVGKTHLVQASINHILEQKRGTNMKYVTAENFADDCIEAIRHGGNSSSKLRKEYRSLDILVLDNLEYLNNKAATRTELFFTTDEL